MADLVISINIDANDAEKGAKKTKSALREVTDEAKKTGAGVKNLGDEAAKSGTKIDDVGKKSKTSASDVKNLGDESQKSGGKMRSLAQVDFAALGGRLKSLGGTLSSVGSQVQGLGIAFTAAFTVPLTAIATLGVKSALRLDEARTKITALIGDGEAAQKKLDELFKLADSSVGVTRTSAVQVFGQLKGIGDIADSTADAVIRATGRLNAAFKLEDLDGFVRNIVQIFSQGFERADIKEAIGRVPIFSQLLEQAFGTQDADQLRKLKDAGKLTLDGFLTGISQAIETDPRTANITENLTTKLAKAFERLDSALAPIGDAILKLVVPIIEQLEPVLTRLLDGFKNLSPEMKTAIVVFGAIVAAIGPVLVVVGTLIVSIGGVVTAIGAIVAAGPVVGIVLAAIAGLTVQLGVVLGIVAVQLGLLYAAWQTNFGGIRELAGEVAAFLQRVWNEAMTAIGQLTEEVLAEITKFWEENGADITAAAEKIGQFLKTTFTTIANFIRENSGGIVETISAAWQLTVSLVRAALQILGGIIKTVTALINGDWQKFWDGTVEIVDGITKIWAAVLSAAGTILAAAVTTAFGAIWDLSVGLSERARQLGIDIANGIGEGLLVAVPSVLAKGGSLINRLMRKMREEAQTQSPSRVTIEIGSDIARGLAVGLLTEEQLVVASAEQLTGRALEKLEEISRRQDEARNTRRENFSRSQESITGTGITQIEDLQREIELLGAITDLDRQRIDDAFELQRLRRELAADGLRTDEIDELIKLRELDQARRLELLAEIDNRKQISDQVRQQAEQAAEAQRQIEDSVRQTTDAIRDNLRVLVNDGFGRFFDNIKSRFKDFLADLVTQYLTSSFFKTFFGTGGAAAGGGAAQGPASGGIFGGILGGIRGIFSLAGGGGSGSGSASGGSTGTVAAGGGSISNTIQLPNGQRVTVGSAGRISQTIGALSSLGVLAGSAIGGRVGGVISNVSQGALIGLQFGGPIGAAIGAGVGLVKSIFGGLFGGSAKEKRDKKEKLPQLERGFTDALAALRALIGDVRTLRVDPESAIAQASDIRNQIASGFGIQFESKKFQKQAAGLIAARLREADTLLDELRGASEIARAAAARERRIIPEFATGVFLNSSFIRQFNEFKRRNGLLEGAFSAGDRIPALLSGQELVLNPAQQIRVRQNAGFDVFQGAGIPGIGGQPRGVVAAGGTAAAQEPINLTLVFEHEIDSNGLVRTSLKNSPDVRREVRVVVQDAVANNEIKLKRRGL